MLEKGCLLTIDLQFCTSFQFFLSILITAIHLKSRLDSKFCSLSVQFVNTFWSKHIRPHDPAQGSVYLYFGSKLLFTFFTGFSLLSFSRRVFSRAATAQFLCQQPTTWSAFGARLHSKMDDHVCFKDDKPAFSRRGAVAPRKISACGTLSGSGWVNLGVFRTECDGQALI